MNESFLINYLVQFCNQLGINKALNEDERIDVLGGKKAREKRAKTEAEKAAKAASKKSK